MDDFERALAKAKEESLRIYKEVELPRQSLDSENGKHNDNPKEKFEELSQGNVLYKGKDAEGFHLAAGNTYIYPSNFPERKYQADIVPTALFHNTLVCLPTGLGKTFIAAVVMYNFYRWYPLGKVIFMAPTRPLVAQQMNACREIMAIPADDTIEMTGTTNPQERQLQWNSKRVLYLTPQVMINDLRNNLFNPSLIKCLVIDEAHRATKGYAYCQVVQNLFEEGINFRLVGLSATPGSDAKAVKEVVQNLHIEKLEVRSDDSPDVTPYTHDKLIDKVVVELSPVVRYIWNKYLKIYEVYLRRIRDMKALNGNITTMSKYQVLLACKKFSSNPPSTIPGNLLQLCIADFNVCVSLAHARELLETYGLRTFYNYFIEAEKPKDKSSSSLSRLCHDNDLRKLLNEIENIISQDSSNPEKYVWSHPKIETLVNVVRKHFQSCDKEEKTKAIVFCQFRLVVSEVFEVLKAFVPEVKPVMFIGQGGEGLPQKKQIEVMKMFRSGEYNVLIATCVAEEGLDIGDVDLLVLVEAHRSPVRLVQRLGRTGRHRNGRCVVLLTKGHEEKKFQDGMTTHKNYKNVVNSHQVVGSLQKSSPRMIPKCCNPEKLLLHVNVPNLNTHKKNKKQSDIRQVFNNSATRDKSSTFASPYLNKEELEEVKNQLGSYIPNFDRLPSSKELWHRRFDEEMKVNELVFGRWSALSVWNDSNKEPQKKYFIGNSKDTDILVHALNKADELKTGKPMVKDFKVPSSSLWSTVKSSKQSTYSNTDEISNKIIKNNKKPRQQLTIVSKLRPVDNSFFSELNKKKYKVINIHQKKTELGNSYLELDINYDHETDDVILEDKIDNLLDNVLKNFVNIYHEFEETCAFEKNLEITNFIKKYIKPVNTTLRTGGLPRISKDLLEDITYEDFSNLNVKDILKCNNSADKENISIGRSNEDYFSPFDVHNDPTPVNLMDNLNDSFDTIQDDAFIGIDDLFNIFKEDVSNNVKENIDNKILPVSKLTTDTNSDFNINDNFHTKLEGSKNLKIISENKIKENLNTVDDFEKVNNICNINKNRFGGVSPYKSLLQNIENKPNQQPVVQLKRLTNLENNATDNSSPNLDRCDVDDNDSDKINSESEFIGIDDLLKTQNDFFNTVKLKTSVSEIARSNGVSNVEHDDSSHDSSHFIPGTPENKGSVNLWTNSPEILEALNLRELERDVSPILSCKNNNINKTNLSKNTFNHFNDLRYVSPVLSGKLEFGSAQIKCSTPLNNPRVASIANKNIIEVVNNCPFENNRSCNKMVKELSKKKLFDYNADDLSSNESSECNESWSVDEVIKNSLNVSPEQECKRLSYYLNTKSLCTITQLVRKSEELENIGNDKKCEEVNVKFNKNGNGNYVTDTNEYNSSNGLIKNNSNNNNQSKKDVTLLDTFKKIESQNLNEIKKCEEVNVKLNTNSNSNYITNNNNHAKNVTLTDTLKKIEPPNLNEIIIDQKSQEIFNEIPTKTHKSKNVKQNKSNYLLWDSSEDDMFANLSPEKLSLNKTPVTNKSNELIDLTIFESDNSENGGDNLSAEQENNVKDNSITNNQPRMNSGGSSPILCSQRRKLNLSFKSQKLTSNKKKLLPTEISRKKSNITSGNKRQLNNSLKENTVNKSKSSTSNCSTTSRSIAELVSSSSDSDVFELPKKVRKPLENISNDLKKQKINKKKDKQRRHNAFIESEAEVSGETSSGPETSGLDDLDESFIDDFTQKPEASIYKKYAEAVKGTDCAGGFKIPMLSDSVMERDVYSQAVPTEHESYVNDSFCVVTSQSSSCSDGMSYLERAELELAKRLSKKRKKLKRKKKRKRIRTPTQSDSETDFDERSCLKNISKSSDSFSINHKSKRRKIVVSSESD